VDSSKACHVELHQFFLRDLKEDGLIIVKWILTDDNNGDIFMKNLYGPLFEKYAKRVVGRDEYIQYGSDNIDGNEAGEWITVTAKKKHQSMIKDKRLKPPNLMPMGRKVQFIVRKSQGKGAGGHSDGCPRSVHQPLSVNG
jgi:hypothetical protein